MIKRAKYRAIEDYYS